MLDVAPLENMEEDYLFLFLLLEEEFNEDFSWEFLIFFFLKNLEILNFFEELKNSEILNFFFWRNWKFWLMIFFESDLRSTSPMYLSAIFCIYFFGSCCMFGLFIIGGDTLTIYVSCFTLFTDLYLWGYSWYMSLFLCFVKSRSYFVLLVFSTHAFMHLLSVLGIYRLIQSCCCLHLQLIDSS